MAISVNIDFGERKNGKSTQLVDCLHVGDTDYTPAGGIDVSVNDFTPIDSTTGNYRPFSCVRLGEGSGNIEFEYEGGGKAIYPFYVSAEQGSIKELLGERIKTIFNKDTGNTTFSGKIWPIW